MVNPGDLPSDEELLRRVMLNMWRTVSFRHSGVRWHAVGEVTGLGSAYAAHLCRRFGLDPDDKIGETEWSTLGSVLGEDFDERTWDHVTYGEEPPTEDKRELRR